jgi:aminomethyltransferase
MKKTALTAKHIELGAKMVEFAGYSMPIQYTGVNDEHETVRSSVGVFDVSHMGEFEIKGPGALDFLQKVSSNDVSKLEIGQAQYGCLPNGKGGIVDDFLTYKIDDNEYFCVMNASNIDKDWDWFNKQNDFDCELVNNSDSYSLLAVQGPKAVSALQKLTDVDLSEIPYYRFKFGTMAGIENVMISATGYTGSGGFELYIHNEDAGQLWDAVLQAGAEFGIKPIGLAARDTLRLEMGFCLYGNDIDDTTSPLEAGLGWITKFSKDFIDKDFLEKQKEEGVKRKLIAFEMLERGIPRKDYPITDGNGNQIGHVTSGTMGPSVKKAIGLAYVSTECAKVDTEIAVSVRNKELKAKVVKLPFYKKA